MVVENQVAVEDSVNVITAVEKITHQHIAEISMEIQYRHKLRQVTL